MLGRYDDALSPLSAAAGLEPDDMDVIRHLAQTYYELGRYDQAIPHFLSLLSEEPEDPALYLRLGLCLYEAGDREQAIAQLNQAVEKLGVDLVAPEAYRYLGWSYYDLERYEEALYLFERSVIFESEDADTYNGLGWCYYQLGQCGDAAPMFERALELEPKFEMAIAGKSACQ